MVFKDEFRTMNNVFETLATLDYFCDSKGIEVELIVLGGSALLTVMEMKNGKFRATRDVDINIVKTNNMKHLIEEVKNLNIHIVSGIIEVPPLEDFIKSSNHLKLDLDFKAIKVYLPSLELLVCTKLFTKRKKDLDDLENTDILTLCNKHKLLELVCEYKKNLLNPADPDLNYHTLDRLFKEKGI